LEKIAILPLVMIIGEFAILGVLLMNALVNKFNLKFTFSII